MKYTIKPFSKHILIKPEVEKGVFGETNCSYGLVQEIGDKVENVKVGELVAYEGDYGLNTIEVDKELLVFISEDSPFLVCKLEKNETDILES